jgi:uncharacterized protein YndB with AHSA1/START domain
MVFRAWTDPEQVAQWWGPHGFTTIVQELDARPGGTLRVILRGPDGTDYPMVATFREVASPERLVFFSQVCPVGNGKYDLETLTTVEFTEEQGHTRMHFRVQVLTAGPSATFALAGMEIGWNQTLDRLAALVSAR